MLTTAIPAETMRKMQQAGQPKVVESDGAKLGNLTEELLNVAERTLGNSRELDAMIFGVTPPTGEKNPAVPTHNGLVLQTIDRLVQAIHILNEANEQLVDTTQRLH